MIEANIVRIEECAHDAVRFVVAWGKVERDAKEKFAVAVKARGYFFEGKGRLELLGELVAMGDHPPVFYRESRWSERVLE